MPQIKVRFERLTEYLVYFILAVLPLERIPALHPQFGGFEVSIRLSQIAGLILILISLPMLWKRRDQLATSPWRWATLFIFLAIISTGLALSLNRALMVTAFIGFDIVLAWTLSNQLLKERLQRYQTIIIWSGIAASLFGLFQFFGDLRGLSTHITGLLPRYTKAVFSFPRVQSTGYEPLFFADYLLLPLSLAVIRVFQGRKKYMIPVLIMMMAFWLTLSRGAYAGLAASLIALAIWAFWHRLVTRLSLVVISIVAGVLLATGAIAISQQIKVAGSNTGSSTNQKKDSSLQIFADQSTNITQGDSFFNRSATWNVAIQAFKQHPLLGIGPGNFGIYAHKDNPAYFLDDTSIVNNEPLELLAENGLLGTLALIAFVASLGRWAWKKRRRELTEFSFVKAGLIAALIGIAVQYQTFSTLYITHIWIIIGLLAGTLLLEARDKKIA